MRRGRRRSRGFGDDRGLLLGIAPLLRFALATQLVEEAELQPRVLDVLHDSELTVFEPTAGLAIVEERARHLAVRRIADPEALLLVPEDEQFADLALLVVRIAHGEKVLTALPVEDELVEAPGCRLGVRGNLVVGEHPVRHLGVLLVAEPLDAIPNVGDEVAVRGEVHGGDEVHLPPGEPGHLAVVEELLAPLAEEALLDHRGFAALDQDALLEHRVDERLHVGGPLQIGLVDVIEEVDRGLDRIELLRERFEVTDVGGLDLPELVLDVGERFPDRRRGFFRGLLQDSVLAGRGEERVETMLVVHLVGEVAEPQRRDFRGVVALHLLREELGHRLAASQHFLDLCRRDGDLVATGIALRGLFRGRREGRGHLGRHLLISWSA